MCTALPDACFGLWWLHLTPQALSESPVSFCVACPQWSGPQGSGLEGPGEVNETLSLGYWGYSVELQVVSWIHLAAFNYNIYTCLFLTFANSVNTKYNYNKNPLTKSVDFWLSSHRVAMPWTVALTSGSVFSIVASVASPFLVGGGSCRVRGLFGIQPP